MNVNAVIDHSIKFDKYKYVKEEPTGLQSPSGMLEKPKDDLDLVTLSDRLRKQAPTEGLSIPYDPTAPVEEPEAIKVQTMPPCLQEYYLSKENAKNGQIDDYFFDLDFDTIRAHAQRLAERNEYDPDSLEAEAFIMGLSEFFGETDEASLKKSFEQLVQECSDSLKNGKAIDLNELKTTFSLLGEDVSIGQIFDMSSTASKLAKVGRENGGSGTNMYFGIANRSLVKAATEKYADTLPEGIGKVFSEKLTKLVDNTIKQSMQTWKQDGYYNGDSLKGFHNFVTQASEYGNKLFSESNLSQADFTERLNQFNQFISSNTHPGTDKISNRILTEAYDKVCKAIS